MRRGERSAGAMEEKTAGQGRETKALGKQQSVKSEGHLLCGAASMIFKPKLHSLLLDVLLLSLSFVFICVLILQEL